MTKLFKHIFSFNIENQESHRLVIQARLAVIALSLSLLLFALFAGTVFQAAAQASDETWDEPVNLSRSGGTDNPQLVIDSRGKVHVIWEDRFDGYFYTFHDVDEWSSPVDVELPFEAAQIQLLADHDGFIHAFWIDEDDQLQHSKVTSDDFIEEEAWEAPSAVGISAVNFAALVDDDSNLHVVYVRPVQTTSSPAGIYYKNSVDGGVSWSSPIILYRSSYLRGVTGESSHVSISSSISEAGTRIFVSWDNRSRKQVFLAKSEDRGETWSEPIEVDHPGSEIGASRPFNIKVSAQDDNVLLIWENGILGMSCTQYYTWSNDGGETWSERQPLPASISGCPQETNLSFIKQNITLLLTGEQWQGYIQAWDGSQWSDSKGQTLISTFEDPEIFESIALQCRQSAYHPIYDRLFVVGCDTSGGGDIWISSRLIGDVDHWYPQPPVWTHPETIKSDEDVLSSLVMAAGSDEKAHIIWTVNVPGSSDLNPLTKIFYTRVDENSWTRPTSISGLPGANPGSPSIALDSVGRLLMVWADSNNGKIYFQWANASLANSPSSWISPRELPSNVAGARSPYIVAKFDEMIYVTYVVPLNEGRGVYLTWSSDRGESWSQPARVFDAESAGWEMVNNPRLAVDETGSLHALFMRHSLPGGRGSLGLYYTRSSDGGETWIKGEPVVEKPVLWSRIVSAGDRGLHRAWMEVDAGRRQILHQYSQDGGATWTRSEIISNYAGESGFPVLTVDSANRLHLLQAGRDIVGDLFLQHWQWDGVFWYAQDNFSLEDLGELSVTGFYAAITKSGKINTVINTSQLNGNTTIPPSSIVITSRRIDIPDTPLQPLSAPQSQVVSTPVSDLVPLPTLTPTHDLAVLEDFGLVPITSEPAGSGFFGLLIGGSLATLLVGLAFVVGVRKVKGKR